MGNIEVVAINALGDDSAVVIFDGEATDYSAANPAAFTYFGTPATSIVDASDTAFSIVFPPGTDPTAGQPIEVTNPTGIVFTGGSDLTPGTYVLGTP